MKSAIYLLFFLVTSFTVFSQKQAEATNQFIISGLVDNVKKITFSDLLKEKSIEIGDLKITNHAGEFRKEYKQLKGVSLIDLLKDVTLTAETPRVLSQYYFVVKASDGYSVVISWNELFNTEIGNSFFIVTEANGKSLAESNDRILLIATKDFKTGRRHVKGLQSIEVKKI